MKMSEEMAVRLHRMMWSDMQRELGDTPPGGERNSFKEAWIETHFPGERVYHNCFLCEYASGAKEGTACATCSFCPIKWSNDTCWGPHADTNYLTSPISKILELPARNEDLNVVINPINDDIFGVLAYSRTRNYIAQDLADVSGLDVSLPVKMHISRIQEKAVEEYFSSKPAAKLATMDVDQAFKQYADEQKAPIFKQLSKASGLSENNHAVLDHIEWIKNKSKQEGRDETNERMKYLLAKQSGLDRNRPVDDHIREIVKNSMEAGAAEERDRIQEKIYEVLLS